MSSITVSSLVLGSLTVEVDGSDSILALSVLGTAPASLSIELGTPGATGTAATIAVGTTSTLSPGASATVANVGTSSAAVFNFGIPTGQTGPAGATGATGSPGTAATIAAGTTTTGAPGSSASVTNSGTTSAAVFDFAIPRGDVGATGATGATGAAGPGVAVGGTTGQLLAKASGTNYDTTWTTVIPGDRYLTTSTTSLTINNATKTLTVGTGLSYTPTQNITISYDASNHMHGEVLTYNSGTGVMTVDVNHHTGTGTYATWTVNVGGVTPVTSTAWGAITGTLSAQTDLQTALDLKSPLASPTFTGVPAAPTATAGTNTTQIATTAFVLANAPSTSFATNAQALLQSSTTTALAPATIPFALSNGLTQRFDYINTTSIAGSGALTTAFTGYREMYTNSTGSIGRASFASGSVGVASVFSGLTSEAQINFSKKIWLSGRFMANLNATYVGDANGFVSISLGGYTTNNVGAMTVKGIGLRKVGGASSVIELVVHNGTSQTLVSTTKAMGTLEVVEYLIYSDGAGNVQLYLNGSLAVSSSAGPTGATANYQGVYREQAEQTASATVRHAMHCFGGQIILER